LSLPFALLVHEEHFAVSTTFGIYSRIELSGLISGYRSSLHLRRVSSVLTAAMARLAPCMAIYELLLRVSFDSVQLLQKLTIHSF
jgi:hypothetical protein